MERLTLSAQALAMYRAMLDFDNADSDHTLRRWLPAPPVLYWGLLTTFALAAAIPHRRPVPPMPRENRPLVPSSGPPEPRG